jgi:hypothetical protein
MALVLLARGARFEPARDLKLFLLIFLSFYISFGGIEGSNSGQNGMSSAAFLSHETTLFKSSLSSYISLIKANNRTVPEMG